MARSKTEGNKIVRIEMPKINNLDQQKLLQHKTSRCVSTIIKPLRIFQFVRIGHLVFIRLHFKIGIRYISSRYKILSRQLAVLLLFAFTIYMIVMDPTPISVFACILLIVLSGVYVFVLAIELISHFAGGALHIIPVIYAVLCILLFSEIRVTWKNNARNLIF